jgi:Gluconate 2-dehydrogenase subunit 3
MRARGPPAATLGCGECGYHPRMQPVKDAATVPGAVLVGLAAAGVLASLGLLLARRLFAGYPRLTRPLEWLSAREVAFVEAAGETLLPPGGAVPPSAREVDLAGYVDRYVAAQPPRTRLLMRLLFLLVEQATLVLSAPGRGGRRRFSSLDAEQRVAVLRGWEESRLFARRLVFTSLRAIVSMGFLNHPRVARQLGLAPRAIATPVLEPDLLYPPVGQPRSAIRYTRADLTAPSDGTPLAPDAPLRPDFAEEGS